MVSFLRVECRCFPAARGLGPPYPIFLTDRYSPRRGPFHYAEQAMHSSFTTTPLRE